jgi:methionyl-tRNA formyltransferase
MAMMNRPLRAVVITVRPGVVTSYEKLLRERGHKLVGVLTAPGPNVRRSDEYREVLELARPGLDVIISNYPSRWADMIRPWKPDLIFCMAFNWKIPADVLEVPPLGASNGHDGLLPKYRGRNATAWALRTGAPGYGITFHRMTPEFDDGAILAQRPIVISDDDDVDSVLPRFFQGLEEAQQEALDRMIAGDPGIPQDESEATYTGGAFEPEWREIDWTRTARDVHFQVRSWCGLRGTPRGAFGEVAGERGLVIKTQLVREPVLQANDTPGTILARDQDSLLIQCGDGPLRVLKWELAG